MTTKPLSRRAILRGAGGAAIALPFLEAMTPRLVWAQAAPVGRFFGFFYPNGTDPAKWNPVAGPLNANTVSPCLQDLKGFAAEGIWPSEQALVSDVTAVTGIHHGGVCVGIHVPSMSLSAHRGGSTYPAEHIPPHTLDQYLADRLQGTAPYRNLAMSASTESDIIQNNISFRTGGEVASVERNPRNLFNTLFPGGSMMMSSGGSATPDKAQKRLKSVLDFVLEDANRLNAKLGAGDKQRLGQYLQAISEVEKQIITTTTTAPAVCTTPAVPGTGGNWHAKSKLFIDLAVLAMACDRTRVATLQYSDSWGVNYTGYSIGSGAEALKDWDDHHISHKLDSGDHTPDLDGLPRAEALRVSDARVVLTSRFKVRRFSYLVSALKRTAGSNGGTLFDETLALYVSENGDGFTHDRANMPVLVAGKAGGFPMGRVVDAKDKPTGALHASIIKRLGIEVSSYGDPAGSPIPGL